jgi:arsenate reductase
LLDQASRAYRQGGLAYLRMDEEEMLARALAEPGLLRLPLVRYGQRLTVGVDEGTWRSWAREHTSSDLLDRRRPSGA